MTNPTDPKALADKPDIDDIDAIAARIASDNENWSWYDETVAQMDADRAALLKYVRGQADEIERLRGLIDE